MMRLSLSNRLGQGQTKDDEARSQKKIIVFFLEDIDMVMHTGPRRHNKLTNLSSKFRTNSSQPLETPIVYMVIWRCRCHCFVQVPLVLATA